MRTDTLLLAALAIAGSWSAGAPAHAAEWPQRTVKIVAPFPAGGLSDGIARLVAQRLSETIGQQVIVENRPGAAGAIGAEAVARAPADGYTLLLASPSQIAIVPAMTKTRYDPVKDLAPVSLISTSSTALVVNPGFPAKSLPEFVAHARAQPAKLSYASGGIGTHNNLGMVLLLKRAGIEMVHVTYKGGVQAMADVVAGHVPVMLANLADALPQAASGAVRIIAVTGERRAPAIPDVPTVSESGFRGFKIATWNGLMAPAGTPKPIIDRIAAELARAVKDPKIAERLTAMSAEALGGGPEEFAATIAADIPVWAEAVSLAGLKE
jgi:tripartite-type tricarboxylate transporter receptor subunit TctC